MPIKNNIIVCLNHPEIAMVKVDGFNAITSIALSGEQIQFLPNSGVAVSIHYCEVCGYVENYIAPKIKGWDAAEANDYVGFESGAIRVLRANQEKLKVVSIESSVRLRLGEENVEIDAIGLLKDGGKVFFEMKSSNGMRSLESGVNHLKKIVTLYKKSFPMEIVYGALVVPGAAELNSINTEFTIVQIDMKNYEITFVQPTLPFLPPLAV